MVSVHWQVSHLVCFPAFKGFLLTVRLIGVHLQKADIIFGFFCSGGRDLSGNKRTNKEQSFDQKFDKMNEALRISCKQGYPVRVVR
jgi:hypothetical protein